MDSHTVIAVLHVALLGPLLLVAGLGYLEAVPAWVFSAVGIFIILYHAFKAYMKIAAGRNAWVNLIHVLIVGPVIAAKGLADPAPRYISELLIMLGVAAIGYHGINLVRSY
jgi:hypothetical protein